MYQSPKNKSNTLRNRSFYCIISIMKKRIFITLPVSDSVRELLSESQQSLIGLKGIHIIDPIKLHATLLFLDEVDIKYISIIKDILQDEASSLSRVNLSLGDIGGFPADTEATIIHATFSEPASQPLRTLRARLWKKIAPHLTISVLHEWTPHITIARSHESISIRELNLKLTDMSWSISTIELWQSILGPTGTEYSVLSKVNLR